MYVCERERERGRGEREREYVCVRVTFSFIFDAHSGGFRKSDRAGVGMIFSEYIFGMRRETIDIHTSLSKRE